MQLFVFLFWNAPDAERAGRPDSHADSPRARAIQARDPASASRHHYTRAPHRPGGNACTSHTHHTPRTGPTRQRLPQSRASRKWRPPSSSSRAISIGAPSAVVTPRENGPHIPSPNVAGIRMYGAPLGSGSR